MIDRGHPNAADDYADDRVWDSLEFLNKGWRGVWNQMKAAYMKREQVRDIQAISLASFC